MQDSGELQMHGRISEEQKCSIENCAEKIFAKIHPTLIGKNFSVDFFCTSDYIKDAVAFSYLVGKVNSTKIFL